MSDHAGHAHGNAEGADDDTLGLRIGAVFVVLAAGIIGGIPPLYLEAFKDMSHPVARMLRAAAAGIVMSLGFVHVLPHGVEEFGILAIHVPLKPYYNPAGPAVIFGILMMMIIEGLAHSHGHEDVLPSPGKGAKDDSSDDDAVQAGKGTEAEPRTDVEHQGHKHVEVCLHEHGHVGNVNAFGTFKQKTMAHMFEFGCVVHSVIIGILLGILNKDYPQARNMLIALTFHQWLEGIGLGAMISVANFGLLKGWLLIGLYSVTAPVGIAIGIGIAEGYDSQSTAASATQGTLNCVSAGILIYMGLAQMVANDFAPESMALLKSRWAKGGCYVAFFVAAGCMSFLAIWA
ncbi:zinc-nutrition responsive transporter [Dunaliella salina]|uniref:Zinc-nutrition responsive transporter n=1 Tax=Dunaliella salina TaxID=3046 RepID=A0ABQ7FZY3_DUNSA|nr:zinc-nutrition responsive transporter [Dunaliella salina]|eukprot:KAF5827908.1 zinc-nutrition responsive transporter [Dunaliella salina]